MHTLEKERQSKISHLNFYLRKLDKEKQIKSNESRRKEIKKKSTGINEIKYRKLTEKINEAKDWLSQKNNKAIKEIELVINNSRTEVSGSRCFYW
jgi:hypothetical protein